MKRLGTLLAGLLFAGILLVQGSPVFAASNTIGVNPRRTYTISPGDTVKDFIVVTNTDPKNELNAGIAVLDFASRDNTGVPALDLKDNKPTPWSLKPYLTIPSSVKVGPGKSVNVPYTIAIPKNLGGGSYYSAVRFTAGGNTQGQNVSLSGAAVSLFFVNVPGKTNSSMQLLHFGPFLQSESSTADGSYNTFYSATAPKYLAYDLKNMGNVAEQPTGSIMIKDMFGKQYKLFTDANPDKNIVLIGQTRRIKVCINPEEVTKKAVTGNDVTETECNNPSFKPGRYTASIDLLYGIKNSPQGELKDTVAFWYLPPWFIIGAVVVLLIIAGVIWLIINAIRNRGGNRYKSRR